MVEHSAVNRGVAGSSPARGVLERFLSLFFLCLKFIFVLTRVEKGETIKQYVVDAFTDKVFSGNPAAVCVLDHHLDKDLMQAIAKENNLSETAFALKKREGQYHLRWFTPKEEIDLCGHATLATAYVIMNYYEKELEKVYFDTLSGTLTVEKKAELYEMDFPAYQLKEIEVTKEIVDAIGIRPLQAFMGRDLVCVLETEAMVKEAIPKLDAVKNLEGLLLHLTAPSERFDCISRSFAPKLNIAEDPVCGSGHCHLAPYWAKRLNKEAIFAYQASERGGTLYCTLKGDRVYLAGKACLYAQAELNI